MNFKVLMPVALTALASVAIAQTATTVQSTPPAAATTVQSTTAQPVTASTTVQGTTVQPATASTTVQGTTVQPATASTTVQGTTVQPATTVQSTTVQPATVGTQTVTSSQPTANVTVTAPTGDVATGVATATSPGTISYETRAEAAYRAAGVSSDVIVKMRDYDIKVRDARIANDAALVKRYYTEQMGLLSSQHINGIRTYLRANPVPTTAAAAVTVWEDPAYVSVASPATVVNPTTIVTNEVRTAPVVTRQVQVPVVSGSVPVVVKDPVPVVRQEVSVPAVIRTETAPVNVTQTEEVTKIRTETKSGSSKSSSEKKDEKKND